MSEENLVYLECVREKSKLRVKITSPGFHREANCQCPRDIRIEGMKYSVPMHAVSFMEGPGRKFFYRISGAHIKQIVDSETRIKIDKIFENESDIDCVVCMSNEKSVVFISCGHYVCCEDCSKTVFKTNKKCPICRAPILSIIGREFI